MQTIKEFIAEQGLTIEATRTDANPSMSGSTDMFHWKVELSRPGAKGFSLHYSKGRAHVDKKAARFGRIVPIEPTLPEVLDCLISDAASVDANPLLEDWAAELGYDPDSRTAEKAFNLIRDQAARLRKLLGRSYDQLVRICTEGEADESGKEVGRLVNDGMGGFLNPPGHPEHDWHVATGPEHNPSGNQSLSSAVDCECLADKTRAEARAKLAEWVALPLTDPAVKDWISQVLGYYRNSYRGPGPEPECWHVQNLRTPSKDGSEARPIDEHAGVHRIRQFYPDYQPTAEDLAGAYWGTKPATKTS